MFEGDFLQIQFSMCHDPWICRQLEQNTTIWMTHSPGIHRFSGFYLGPIEPFGALVRSKLGCSLSNHVPVGVTSRWRRPNPRQAHPYKDCPEPLNKVCVIRVTYTVHLHGIADWCRHPSMAVTPRPHRKNLEAAPQRASLRTPTEVSSSSSDKNPICRELSLMSRE